jgi:hypothetical protein
MYMELARTWSLSVGEKFRFTEAWRFRFASVTSSMPGAAGPKPSFRKGPSSPRYRPETK